MAKDNLIHTTVGEVWKQRGEGAIVHLDDEGEKLFVITGLNPYPGAFRADCEIDPWDRIKINPIIGSGIMRETLAKEGPLVKPQDACWVPAL